MIQKLFGGIVKKKRRVEGETKARRIRIKEDSRSNQNRHKSQKRNRKKRWLKLDNLERRFLCRSSLNA
jgi:hypothetical protein